MSNKTTVDWIERFQVLASGSRDQRLEQFYQAGTVAPTTPVVNLPLLAMDFETTGLDANQDEIISIGVQPFTLQRIPCREAQQWLIKPNDWVGEETVSIHHIMHSEVQHAPVFEKVLESLLGIMAGRLVVVHYHHIERPFLARAMLNSLGETIEFPLIDTMVLEKHILLKQRHLVERLLDRPLPSLRLGDCRQRYHLPHYQPHHAMTDALATAELLIAQLSYHYADDTPVSELWV